MPKTTRLRPPAVASIAADHQGASDMLEAFIQASPLAIIVIDPNGIVRQWNRAAAEMFGWTADQAVGRPNPIVPPQAQVEYRRFRKRVLSGEILTGLEVRRQRNDGSLVDVRISSAPLRDSVGNVTGIVAFLEDVTDQKLTDEMRQRIAAIVESSEDAIIGITLDGIIEAWNPGAERMYGFSAEEMIGRSISALLPPGGVSVVHRYRDRLHRGESISHLEVVRKRKDGALINVSLTLSPIREHSGKVTGVATISRDITDRKRAEDEIRRRAVHLEVLNKIITAASLATDVTRLLGVAIDQTLWALGCKMGGIWVDDTHLMHGLAPDTGAAIQRAFADAGVRRPGPLTVGDWDAVEDPASKPLASLMVRVGIRASLTVPIESAGHLFGGLALASSEPRAWEPEEITLIETVGKQLGAAAARLRLFRDTQDHARLMSRLVGLTETLNSPLTVSQAVVALGQGALQLGAADRGAVYVRQPDGTIICPWSLGLSSDHIDEVLAGQTEKTIGRLMAGSTPERLALPDGRTVDARKPFIYADSRMLPEAGPVRPVAERDGYRTVGNFPLIFEGRVIALVSCHYDTARIWTEREQEVYQSFCWQAAVALQNAGLREGQAQRTMELEVLADLSKRLRAARTPEEMYPILVDLPMTLFQASYGSLSLLDLSEQQFTRVHTIGFPSEQPGSSFPLAGSLAGRVVESGVAHVAPDIAAEELPRWRDPARDLAIGPVAIVPVRSEQEIIGTLALGRERRPEVRPFAHAEVRLLQAIAEIGGTAIRRARLYQNLEQSYIQTVLALARTVDARDTYTSGHSERIAVWAETVARACGCGAAEIQHIRWAALLHDIGKVGVPDEILRKPGRLSDEEWTVMRQHPVIGEGILLSTDRMRDVAKIVRHHQERWDGMGYPDGVRGEEIPLGARILAVVDAYSAITDNRPYKAARSSMEAVAELRRCAGTQFDPRIVEIFCHTMESAP